MNSHVRSLVAGLTLLVGVEGAVSPGEASGNRLTYLDDFANPFYPSQQFPKLITPQWVGEAGVELVVTYGIDDMGSHTNYEHYLRPLLERLKQVDGRAPVSIFCNSPNPTEPHLQQWLKEGLSFEVHTLSHPCPILSQSNFRAAQNTFHGCVELLHHVPGNVPVAFRTPCCDSIDSASPRLFAELFARTNAVGQFLSMDSSVALLLTTNDPALPGERLRDVLGRDRFRKYVPFPAFSTTIENYPYPYVHTRRCWEMPFVVPSDWQSHHLQGPAHPQMLEDWKVALDCVARKQGTFNFIFHPANWSSPTQHVAFVDYAVNTYGRKVKFLNYRETYERLTRNLLAGEPLRARDGGDNGVRLLDLNDDGYLDVVVGNERTRQTRIWEPRSGQWHQTELPVSLVTPTAGPMAGGDSGVRFGIVGPAAEPVMLVRNELQAGAWRFREGRWLSEPELWKGLELDGQPLFTSRAGRELGVRFRDVDQDGNCEVLVANETQNAVFAWNAASRSWSKLPYGLPKGVTFVNATGEDNGLRFVDLNGDGLGDVVFSNEDAYSIHLMVPRLILGFQPGWSREVLRCRRGQVPELPLIVRGGTNRNNGAWFTHDEFYVQNEDTAKLPNLVARHPFSELLTGFVPTALSPTQSLATIQVPTNFVVELVAQEPLVQDPVYFDWDEHQRLWVVEMRDYPLGVDGRGRPGAAIRILEDTDADGRYDKSTVFAEGLNFANGLIPWRNGVLVSAAPDILYLEDTNHDGRADRTERLFRGFGEGNQQHRFNGFEYGLDNWLYGANGDSGGSITPLSPPEAAAAAAVSIARHDFRFRPDARRFEAIAGQTQFGRHRDDWGNWFGNANPIWLWHYWLPEHYLRRNPRLAVESLRRETARTPGAGLVHAIGRKPQRLNDVGTAGYVTSANSPTPYRDVLFGADFARAVFISEPVYNAIRCELLEPEGVSFSSQRWHPDDPREFVASTDPWFRPTGLKIGPDGALYIADMYRQFIEHPEWIPDDIKNRYNMRAGEERGRLYRVYPRGATLRRPPNLGALSTDALVAALDHPNGWQRDTVQRLLVTRQDTSAVEPLRKLLAAPISPKARLGALCTLDGLQAITPADLTRALEDASPPLREHAVRLSEGFLRQNSEHRVASQPANVLEPRWLEALLARSDDPELRVRYQLALSLGEWEHPRAAETLARIALRDGNQADILTAVASSSARRPAQILRGLLAAKVELTAQERLLRNLLLLLANDADAQSIDDIFLQLTRPARAGQPLEAWQLNALAHFAQELGRVGRSWSNSPSVQTTWTTLVTTARAWVQDPAKSVEQRVAALRLVSANGFGPAGSGPDAGWLSALLAASNPRPLQTAALAQLAQMRGKEVPASVLRAWSSYSPSVRNSLLDLLLRREDWVLEILEQLEKKQLAIAELGASARQRLLVYPKDQVRSRAQRLLAQPVNVERQKLVDEYLPAVRQATGHAEHGAELFTRHCAVCHAVGQAGGVAPDLASVVERSPERMVISLLDPNRAVEDRYLNYLVRTRGGDEYSGMLASETANNITLVSPSGSKEVLLRSDIVEVQSTRLSLMPEGFEQLLKPQDIADILAYVDKAAR